MVTVTIGFTADSHSSEAHHETVYCDSGTVAMCACGWAFSMSARLERVNELMLAVGTVYDPAD